MPNKIIPYFTFKQYSVSLLSSDFTIESKDFSDEFSFLKDSFDADEHILVVGVDKSGGYGAIVIDLDTKQVIQHHVHSDQPVYNTVQNGEAVLKCLITKSYIITLAPAIIRIWDKTTFLLKKRIEIEPLLLTYECQINLLKAS